MSGAKAIHVAPISSADAKRAVQRWHYSGKVVQNSQLHLGVFLGGQLLGAMQFGPPLDRRKVLGLVHGTPWNGMIELNRMAFSDALPRNSESRALSVAFRLLRKNAPHVQWVLSFADGTQCGDGTIYRASGFVLTGIKKSLNLVRLPSGLVIHKMTLESSPTQARAELGGRSYYAITGGKYDLEAYSKATGGSVIPGFQLRYIYPIDPTVRERLTVPVLPFSTIEERGAGMYKGRVRGTDQRVGSADGGTPGDQPGGGGSNPTSTLHA